MKYRVRVSELRYGDVVVEADDEEQAKTIATGKEIDWFDSELTDMTVEPISDERERTYIVTEMCPHCESEVEMRWNTDTMGFKAFCPVCGERLMLCDECRHTEEPSPCDYGVNGDGCWRNPPKPAPPEIPPALRVDTPLGAVIVRSCFDSEHPGVWVDLRRPDADDDMPLALIEFSDDDTDLPEGQPNIITRVWSNGEDENCTDRIVHQGIEEYFRVEEV